MDLAKLCMHLRLSDPNEVKCHRSGLLLIQMAGYMYVHANM